MSRVEAREVAFCLLFERSYNIRTAPENNRQLFGDVELTDADMEYITRVLAAYDENRGEIDAAIEKNSLHWRLSRIPRADLSLMRLAICEMMYMSDVPPKVAINEAVNLSKLYCEEGGPSFINGVLDGCMKNTL